jgi:histidinol-phosphate/aromatic aminotransferase/cobyric acid decarboxylase-like protein
LEISPDEILPANGASELIWLAALAFLKRGDRVLILGPTYGEYARAAVLMGASVTSFLAHSEDDFALHPDQVRRALRRLCPRLVFLCNPNNPTGAYLEPEEIESWACKFPGTLFVVDEAYLGFVMSARAAGFIPAVRQANTAGINPAARCHNILLPRSMTKDLGLAGLRLGYAVGSADVIDWLARARPPWSVNAFAQAAGIEALRHPDYYRDSSKKLAAAKIDLIQNLFNLGYQPVPSTMPFFLLPVGDGSRFRLSLLKKGILVRDTASFGLPGYVRISTRRPEDNARLLATLAEVPHAG